MHMVSSGDKMALQSLLLSIIIWPKLQMCLAKANADANAIEIDLIVCFSLVCLSAIKPIRVAFGKHYCQAI